jgi:acyl-CoA reductase-like NAD-dependent aldehyde dehydrogenase
MTTIPIRNPRSGEIDGALKPDGATTLDALAADVRARQTEWATLGIAERAIRLGAFADALAASAGEVVAAALELPPNGRLKPPAAGAQVSTPEPLVCRKSFGAPLSGGRVSE